MKRSSPLGAVAVGLAAGAVGTATMTGYQTLASKLRGSGDGDAGPTSWDEAPAPAQVGKRIVTGVFHKDVSPKRIQTMTNVMHWVYGTSWGAIFGLLQGTVKQRVAPSGLGFGAGVWTMSYVQLVPMDIYKPPWSYPATELAVDLSYHLVYGLGVAWPTTR